MSGTQRGSAPRIGVSFILPVLNRRHCVVRAIESCLGCATERVEVKVLVIDGGSIDGTREEIATRFTDDARVELSIQPPERKGFMGACYFGVELVRTELATFMYSDDVLSPELGRLAEAMADTAGTALAMGYGQQAAEDELLDFPAGLPIRAMPPARVLEAFYGHPDRLDGRSLPVSPVCCLVRSASLRSWVDHLQGFVADSHLRQHAMIRLAGGQDLMVYLVALLESERPVLVADGVVAQLTASGESITQTGNRAGQLLVGYWLARVWGMYQAMEKGQGTLVRVLAGYVLAVGVFIVLDMLRRRDMQWMSPVMGEGHRILGAVARRGVLLATLGAAVRCSWARLHMRAQEGN